MRGTFCMQKGNINSVPSLLLSFSCPASLKVWLFFGFLKEHVKVVRSGVLPVYLEMVEPGAAYCVKARTFVKAIGRHSAFSQPECVKVQGKAARLPLLRVHGACCFLWLWVSPCSPWPAPPGCTGSGGESVLCSKPHSSPEVKVHPQAGWGSLGSCLAHFPLKASEAWGQILQSWLTRWPLPANQGPVQVRQLEPLKVRLCAGVPNAQHSRSQLGGAWWKVCRILFFKFFP